MNFTIENIEIISLEDFVFVNDTTLINSKGDTAIIIDIDNVMDVRTNR